MRHHCHGDCDDTECSRCGEVVHLASAHCCHPIGVDRWLLAHIDEAIRRWGTPPAVQKSTDGGRTWQPAPEVTVIWREEGSDE